MRPSPRRSAAAAIEGVLRVTESGCLYLETPWPGNARSDIVWPADWTARRHADGSAQLLDDNGRPVAQTGQYIASGGGGISEPGDLVCEASTDGDVFTIMAEVTVTDLAVGELPLSTSDWRPGDDAQRAQLSGVLQVDEKGCLYVAGPDGHGIDVVWPAGWTAHRLRDGSLSCARITVKSRR